MVHRKTKECVGCGDAFITYRNYDYCVDCAVNNNRYLTNSPCSECDGSGIIKFRYQPPRPCKLCSLTKSMPKKPIKKLTPEQTQEQAEQQHWEEVEEKSKWEIYEILTQNIPLQNLPLIEDNWNVGGIQKIAEISQKVGFFPYRDTDYRVILRDNVPSFYQETTNLPNSNYLAQEVAYWYLHSVIKGLIRSLSAYDCYDPSHFENLTPDDH